MGVGNHHDDTIVAIASPAGNGSRGIVRISGPNTVGVISQVFRSESRSPAKLTSPEAMEGHLLVDAEVIPGRLLIWPTSRSFTKQPSAEFHSFGSRPVLELAVNAICSHGARPAEPGEFTMRAFLSGRLDLTQAEAVLAVIDAKNRQQLDVAIDQLAGGMGARLGETRDDLIGALAELEAGLDFVEEDIEFISNEAMINKLESAQQSLSSLLAQASERDRESGHFRVALFGLPNAGKSSLFNRLADRDLAIVADVQGTTTDRVSSVCKFGEHTVELMDTAGLEDVESTDSIASASQLHRSREVKHCDLALLCISLADKADSVNAQLKLQVENLKDNSSMVVLTQSDLLDHKDVQSIIQSVKASFSESVVIATSAVRGDGVEELKCKIETAALESQVAESAIVGSTMLRTRQSLEEARNAIESALHAARNGIGDEVVASEFRAALDAIGTIVGTIYTDDVLDVVFGKFCIGK